MVKRDVAGNDAQCGGRNHRVVRETSKSDTAEQLEVFARVSAVQAALMAVAAGNMRFGGHVIARLDRLHVPANRYDSAPKLVTEPKRWRVGTGSPSVPLVDVHIGAADRSRMYLDEHFVALGFIHSDQPQCET